MAWTIYEEGSIVLRNIQQTLNVGKITCKRKPETISSVWVNLKYRKLYQVTEY